MKLYRHDIDRVFKDSRFNEKFFMRMLWKTSELSKVFSFTCFAIHTLNIIYRLDKRRKFKYH